MSRTIKTQTNSRQFMVGLRRTRPHLTGSYIPAQSRGLPIAVAASDMNLPTWAGGLAFLDNRYGSPGTCCQLMARQPPASFDQPRVVPAACRPGAGHARRGRLRSHPMLVLAGCRPGGPMSLARASSSRRRPAARRAIDRHNFVCSAFVSIPVEFGGRPKCRDLIVKILLR